MAIRPINPLPNDDNVAQPQPTIEPVKVSKTKSISISIPVDVLDKIEDYKHEFRKKSVSQIVLEAVTLLLEQSKK